MPQPRKTYDEIWAIISQIGYPERRFWLGVKGDGFLLQCWYEEADVETGKIEVQRARKYYVSPFMTEAEIVETAFMACERSLQHQLREHFLYKGRRIYSPHFRLEDRIAVCDAEKFDESVPPGKGAKWMMQPFRGNEPIVVEKRDAEGKLCFGEPQPPKFETTLDEVYQWQFADDAQALGTWDELKAWLDERGWKLRAKTW